MAKSVVLRGYRFSVYHRIARIVLFEKGIDCQIEDVNPFDASLPASFLQRHPFGRVPVFSHGAYDIYETVAIARYIDAAFPGPELTPAAAPSIGRMTQVISIVDSYAYRPLIRQVFEHAVFRPAAGEKADQAEIAAGLKASSIVLDALDRLATEGLVLNGTTFTLADCHLAPMIACFAMAPEGADALRSRPALSDWWSSVAARPSLVATEPGLPEH